MYREWIPVEKALPEQGGQVWLVTSGIRTQFAYYDPEDGWEGTHTDDLVPNVKAWMPPIAPFDPPPFECQPNCGHSAADHEAFDDGWFDNEPPEDSHLREVWEIGRSANDENAKMDEFWAQIWDKVRTPLEAVIER